MRGMVSRTRYHRHGVTDMRKRHERNSNGLCKGIAWGFYNPVICVHFERHERNSNGLCKGHARGFYNPTHCVWQGPTVDGMLNLDCGTCVPRHLLTKACIQSYRHAHTKVHIHTHTRSGTHWHTHKYTHTCTCTCAYTQFHICAYTHTHTHIHTHSHTHTHTHTPGKLPLPLPHSMLACPPVPALVRELELLSNQPKRASPCAA